MIIFADQTTKTINYITSPEGLTAIVVASSNTAGREWYWVFTDHLGSITALVRNSDGEKLEMSYDAWGNRRNPATWETYTNNMPTFITDRGFTGHEHLDEFSLINMNGRLYDPQTTRFLSPDPIIADPGNPAGYNPYAYVLNNPLKYTDPSGYVVDPVSIAAYVIAAAIIYSSAARANGNLATGSYEWDFTKWWGKDKPGFGGIGYSTNSSFTNSTYFVSINPTNGSGGTLGYNTQYGWGSGSSPQDMYFPNYNSGVSEVAAVNNIASSQGNYNQMAVYVDNFMDKLAEKVMGGYEFYGNAVIKIFTQNFLQNPNTFNEDFYYNALDGLVMNNGRVLKREELSLTFKYSATSNALYGGYKNGKFHVNFSIGEYEITIANVQGLAIHEIYGHGIMGYHDSKKNHHLAYMAVVDSRYWNLTTERFMKHTLKYMYIYFFNETGSNILPTKYYNEYKKHF